MLNMGRQIGLSCLLYVIQVKRLGPRMKKDDFEMRKSKQSPKTAADEVVITRRERKKQNCKYAIIHAAQDNFEKKGIEGTSINDITTAADISYATFFNYFPSKENLLVTIYAEETIDLKEFVAVKLKNETSAIRKLSELFCEWLKDGMNYKRTSLRVHEVVCLGVGLDNLDDSIQGLFLDFLKEGQDSGEIRTDVPALYMALSLEGLYFSLISHDSSMKVCRAVLNYYLDNIRAK